MCPWPPLRGGAAHWLLRRRRQLGNPQGREKGAHVGVELYHPAAGGGVDPPHRKHPPAA